MVAIGALNERDVLTDWRFVAPLREEKTKSNFKKFHAKTQCRKVDSTGPARRVTLLSVQAVI
jgi:hypothetical protein